MKTAYTREDEIGIGPDTGDSKGAAAILLAVLINRRKRIAAAWVACFAVFAVIAFMLPKRYSTSVTFQMNSQGAMKLGLPEGLKMLDPRLGSGGQGQAVPLAILDSRKLAMTIIEMFHLKKRYRTKWDHLAIKAFRKNFEYEVFDDGVVTLSFTHPSRDTVKIVADSILSYLNRETKIYSSSKARQEFEFNKGQVDSVFRRLDSLSLAWIAFMKRTRMVDFERHVELSLRSYGKIQESLVELEGEYALSRIDNNRTPQDRDNLRTLIDLLRRKQADLSTSHANGSVKGPEGRKGRFDFSLDYDSIPSMSAYLEKINLLVEKDKIVLKALLPKLEDSRLKMVENTPVLNVIDPSYVPPYKSGPKRIFIIAVGTVVSGAILTTLLVLLEMFLNPAFRSRKLDELLVFAGRFK